MKLTLNKRFYRSSDFIFAIYLLATQLLINANQRVVVNDLKNVADKWTWLLIALAFLLKSFFPSSVSNSKKISNKLYFTFWIVMILLDLVIFTLSISNVIPPTLVWRSFLVVMFFGLFFSYAYGEKVIESKKNQNFQFRFFLLLAIAVMFAIPILLMGMVWK